MEEFRTITNYGNYMVSNYGNIKNKVGKLLKIRLNNGYNRVRLYNNDGPKNKLVHRLVCEHFLDLINDKYQVNHKDGNRLNNNVNNLEWCTHQENQKHRYKVLSDYNIILKKDNINFKFKNLSEASRELKLNYQSLMRLKHNKIKSFKGFELIKKEV
jgi:hypothetical protein